MGRKRKDDAFGLPPRVYAKHGAFYYVHPTGKWERIGTDLAEARKRGNLYNDPGGEFGTMAHYMDAFIVHCKKRTSLPRKKGGLSKRTYDDYSGAVELLKLVFGKSQPHQIEGHHIAGYLDNGLANGRGVRANREKACLSACFSWMLRQPGTGIKTNPCIGIRRNPESKRDRYVTHAEYEAVQAKAIASVRAFMDLIYRTLQRPEDVIFWGPANLVTKRESDGTIRKVIRHQQGKTETKVDILVTPEIDAVLQSLMPKNGVALGPGSTFLRNRSNKPYTYSGISSMLRRYIKAAGISESFGFYDLKGKGATDMWRDGVPLEVIQVLCAHESKTTTEIYVKARWTETVTPNQTKMAG